MLFVNVAKSNNPAVVLTNKLIHIARPLPAKTDTADSDTITRSNRPGLAQSRR